MRQREGQEMKCKEFGALEPCALSLASYAKRRRR